MADQAHGISMLVSVNCAGERLWQTTRARCERSPKHSCVMQLKNYWDETWGSATGTVPSTGTNQIRSCFESRLSYGCARRTKARLSPFWPRRREPCSPIYSDIDERRHLTERPIQRAAQSQTTLSGSARTAVIAGFGRRSNRGGVCPSRLAGLPGRYTNVHSQ